MNNTRLLSKQPEGFSKVEKIKNKKMSEVFKLEFWAGTDYDENHFLFPLLGPSLPGSLQSAGRLLFQWETNVGRL